MGILKTFMLDGEFKFKTHLGLEFLQIKIPALHLVLVGKGLPNPRDRRVESSFDDDRFRQILFCGHNFLRLIILRWYLVPTTRIHFQRDPGRRLTSRRQGSPSSAHKSFRRAPQAFLSIARVTRPRWYLACRDSAPREDGPSHH